MEKENLNEVLDGMEHTEEVKEDAVQEVKDDVAVQPQIDETVQTEEAIQEEQTVAEDVTPAEVTAEVHPKKKIQFKPEKISQMRTRFFLWRQDMKDIFRRRKGTKSAVKIKAKEAIAAEREKLYNQFVNRLIILLINGLAVGALLLAALDYIVNAQIPERNPILLTIFLMLALYCAVYWFFTYRKGKGVDGLRGLAIFALIFSLIGSSAGVYDVYMNHKNLSTYFYGEKIAIKNQQETALLLASYIDTWRHTPNYSQVHVAENAYYAVVYNSKGESLAQLVTTGGTEYEKKDPTSNMTVVLTDGTAVIATEKAIERRRDVDNLRYVELALQWVAKGNARLNRYSTALDTVKKQSVPADGLPGTEYTVTISGLNNIKKFYASIIGEKEAQDIFYALSTVDGQVDLIYQIALDSSYIGVASLISVAGKESLLWYIDNYVAAYDWELGHYDWYNYDYKDPDKNEKMLQTALYNASAMLERLGKALGIDPDAYADYTDDPSDTSIDHDHDGDGKPDH